MIKNRYILLIVSFVLLGLTLTAVSAGDVSNDTGVPADSQVSSNVDGMLSDNTINDLTQEKQIDVESNNNLIQEENTQTTFENTQYTDESDVNINDLTKSKNLKAGTVGTRVTSWADIGTSGTYYLANNITIPSNNNRKTLTGSLTIDGNGYTINANNVNPSGTNTLGYIDAGAYTLTIYNATISNIPANRFFITNGNSTFTNVNFTNIGGIVRTTSRTSYVTLRNCTVQGRGNSVFVNTTSYSLYKYIHNTTFSNVNPSYPMISGVLPEYYVEYDGNLVVEVTLINGTGYSSNPVRFYLEGATTGGGYYTRTQSNNKYVLDLPAMVSTDTDRTLFWMAQYNGVPIENPEGFYSAINMSVGLLNSESSGTVISDRVYFKVYLMRYNTTTTITFNQQDTTIGIPTTISATVKNSKYNTPVSTGIVTFYVDDQIFGLAEIDPDTGIATLNNAIFNTLSGTLTAVYTDTHNPSVYNTSNSSVQFIINKGTANLNMVDSVRDYVNTTIDLNATVTDSISGNFVKNGVVEFKKGSTVLGQVSIVNGIATLPYKLTTDPSVTITATLISSPDYYTGISDSTVVNSVKIYTQLALAPVVSSVGNRTNITAEVRNHTVTGSNDPVNQGIVKFYRNSSTTETYLGQANVVGGEAKLENVQFDTVSFSDQIKAIYEDPNNEYDTSNSSNSLFVSYATAYIDIPINYTTYYKSDVAITATVKDANTNLPVNGGRVIFTDGRTSYSVNVDSTTGKASYTYNTGIVGAVPIIAQYVNEDKYNTISNTTVIYSTMIPTVTTLQLPDVVSVGNRTTINATVVNDTSVSTIGAGNVPEGSVTFYYNDQLIGTSVVQNGFASIEVVFNTSSTGTVKANYADSNFIYNASADESSMTVNQASTRVEVPETVSGHYGSNAVIEARAYNAITDELITSGYININGTHIPIEDGKATYESQIYISGSVVSYFVGDNRYLQSPDNTTSIVLNLIPTVITVSPVEGVVNNSVPVTAVVKNVSDDTYINQGSVTFYYNELPIGSSSLSNGRATIDVVFNESVTNGLIIAEYTDNGVVYDDATSSSSYADLNIAKLNTTISIEYQTNSSTDFIAPGDGVNITVTLTNASGSELEGKLITVNIYDLQGSPVGEPLTNTTNSSGMITVEFDTSIATTYQIVASFAGDNVFNASSSSIHMLTDKIQTLARIVNQTSYNTERVVTFEAWLFYDLNGTTVYIPDEPVDITVYYKNGSTEMIPCRTDSQGTFFFTFTKDQPNDNFTIYFDYEGSDRYVRYDFTKRFNDSVLTYSDWKSKLSVQINETNILNFTIRDIKDNLPNGTFTITDYETGEFIYNVTVTNGEGIYEYVSPEAKTVRLKGTFVNESANYNEVTETLMFEVTKINTVTEFYVLNHTVANTTIEVKVLNPNNSSSIVDGGTVTFKYGDNEVGSATVEDGIALVKLNDISLSQTYSFEVTYSGNDYFKSNINITTLSVDKSVVTLTLPETYTDYIGNNVSITATVLDTAENGVNDGVVRFTLENGIYYDVEVVDGEAVFTNYIISSVDNYSITAIYTGTAEYYYSTTQSVIVQGAKIPTVTSIDSVTNVVGNTTKITATVINQLDSTSLSQGTVTFYNGEVPLGSASLANGVATINVVFNQTIKDNGAITANYTDDNNIYANSSASNTLTINEGTALVSVPNTYNDYYKSVVQVVVSVTDVNSGEKINAGSVIFSQGENTLDEVNIIDGQAVYEYDIGTGDGATIDVTLNNAYYSAQANQTIITPMEIPTKIAVSSANDFVGSTVTITATVTNNTATDTASKVSQGKVTFTYNNNVPLGEAYVDSDGVASIDVVFNETYIGKIVASYSDAEFDNIYADSNSEDTSTSYSISIDKGEVKVTAEPTTASGYYGQEVTITVKAVDVRSNNPVNGSVIINGESKQLTNGQTTFTYVITTDDVVTVTSSFNLSSNENYLRKTDAQTVITRILMDSNVELEDVPTAVKVSEEFEFKVKLTNATSQPIEGKDISVTVNGEQVTLSGQSDENGYVTAYYTPKNNNTDLSIVATFTTDGIYKSNSDTATIAKENIKLIPTLVTLEVPETVTALEEFRISVNLTNSTDAKEIVSGEVIIYINDTQSNNLETISVYIVNGAKVVTYTPQDNTTLKIYAVYAGDNQVYDANTSDVITRSPNKRQTQMSIEVPATVAIGESFEYEVTLSNNSVVIPNKLVKATINSGQEVTLSYNETRHAYVGTYTPVDDSDIVITAAFDGDSVYDESQATVTIDATESITKIPTQMAIIVPTTVKVAEEFTFKINLTNATGDSISGQVENISVKINDVDYTGQLTYADGLYEGTLTLEDNTPIVIKATFGETELYQPAEAINDTLIIELIDTDLTVEYNNNVNVGDTITIEITLTNEHDAPALMDPSDVTVTIFGQQVDASQISIEEDTLTVTYTTTNDTDIPVVISYPGVDKVYDSASEEFTVSVGKIPTSITIEFINTTAGNVKINVSVVGDDQLDVTDGDITVSYIGNEITLSLDGNKNLTFELSNFNYYGGPYTISATYSGNGTYDVSYKTLNDVYVLPEEYTFTVSANESVYVTENVTINGTLLDGDNNPIANRGLSVNVTHESGVTTTYTVVTQSDGSYWLPHPTTRAGSYNVSVYNGGSNTREARIINTTFVAKLIPTNVAVGIYNNTTGNVKISVNVTDVRQTSPTDTRVTTGVLRVKVGENEAFDVDVAGEETIVDLASITTNDTTQVEVTYLANDVYNQSSTSELSVTAQIRKTDLTISINESTEYNETITLRGKLVDELGLNISGAIISFIFNDTAYTYPDVTTDDYGEFAVEFKAVKIGDFKVNASYAGVYGEYESANDSIAFTVTKIPTDTQVYVQEDSDSTLTILFRVLDDEELVRYDTIKLYVGEVEIDEIDLSDAETTIVNGETYMIAQYTEEYLQLKGLVSFDNSPIVAVYDENEYYLGSDDSYDVTHEITEAIIKVTTNQTDCYVDESITVTVNITDSEGYSIRGNITLQIGENTYTHFITEDENGIWTMAYSNTTAGVYDVKATLTSVIYESVSDATSFIILKVPTRTNVTVHNTSWGNSSIDVVVYDARTNVSINTGELNVSVGNANNTNITKALDDSGLTNIIIPTSYAGTFGINVVYVENEKYASSRGIDNVTGNPFNSITVTNHVTNISVSTDSQSYMVGQNVNISGYLYDEDNGSPLGDMSIVVRVTETGHIHTYGVVTDELGYYSINHTAESEGEFNVSVQFAGLTISDEYNILASTNNTTYTVGRIATVTSVNVLNTTVNNVTIEVNVKGADNLNVSNGTLNIKWGDYSEVFDITGNTTTLVLPLSIIGEAKDLNVTFNGNVKYTGSENITSLKLNNQHAIITVEAIPKEVYVGSTIEIRGYVYDGMNGKVNGKVNLTFIDSNNDIVPITDVDVVDSFFSYTRQTYYVGQIQVIASYLNDTFDNSTASDTYNILKIPTQTNMSIANATYGNVTIKVSVVDYKNNPITSGKLLNITVNGENWEELQDITGETTFIQIPTEDRHVVVTVKYMGNRVYNESVGQDEGDSQLVIDGSSSQISMLTIQSNVTQTYTGEAVHISGTLYDGMNQRIDGSINLTFASQNGEFTMEVPVNNGEYEYDNITSVTGQINVSAKYLGNDTVSAAQANTSYTVNKLPTETIVEVVNNTVGNLTISVTVNETYHGIILESGDIVISYNDNQLEKVLSGEKTLYDLIVNTQAPIQVSVNYTGNATHDSSYASINTGVLELQIPSLTITANETVKVGETVVIKGRLTTDMNDSVSGVGLSIVINNGTSDVRTLYTTTLEDGNYSVEYVPNHNGAYTATVFYYGNTLINQTSNSTTFTVGRIETTTWVEVLNETAGNVTIKVTVLDESGNKIDSGNFNVTVNNENETIFFDSNPKTVSLDLITTNGTFAVEVYYLGNDTYMPSKGNLSEIESFDEITVVIQNSTINVEAYPSTLYINRTVEIVGTLLDGMGRPISGAVINITFTDENDDVVKTSNTTDANGNFYYYRLTEYNGTITVVASYDGVENQINSSSSQTTYTVNKIPTTTHIEGLSATVGNVIIEVWFTSNIDDSYIHNGTFDVIYNQGESTTTYDIKDLELNENGRYTISLPSEYVVGEDTVTVNYHGDAVYNASGQSVSSKVTKDPVDIDISIDPESDYVNRTVKTNISVTYADNPVIGYINVTITNSAGDIVQNVTSNHYLSDGKYSFETKYLIGDEYTVNVVFNESGIYSQTNANKSFTLNKLPTKTVVDVVSDVYDNVTINITVYDTENNEIVKTGVLDVYYNGQSHNIQVNESGTTEYKFDYPESGAGILVTVTYNENDMYNPSVGVNTSDDPFNNIIVTKQPTNITVSANPDSAYLGEEIVISGKLSNPIGSVSQQRIAITINGITAYNFTDTEGNYYFRYDKATSIANGNGTFTVSVVYSGNTTVSEATNQTTITVNKIPTNTTIDILNSTVGNVTITVKVVESESGNEVTTGNIIVYKDDEVLSEYEVTAPVNTMKLTDIEEAGNLNIRVEYAENTMYLASNATLNDEQLENLVVDMQNAVITVTASPNPAMVGESINITGTLVDGMANSIDGIEIVSITIGDEVFDVNVTNGQFKLVNIQYLNGTRNVIASYAGNQTINSARDEYELTVILIPTQSYIGLVNGTVGNVTVNVNVTNATGDIINTGQLQLTVENVTSGQSYSFVTDVNSDTGITVISLEAITELDTIKVSAVYLANNVYNASTAVNILTIHDENPSENVEVTPARHASIMDVSLTEDTVYLTENLTIKGTLVLDNGTNVDNENVSIYANSIFIGNATVHDGEFEFNYQTSAVTGNGVLEIEYEGNDYVNGTSGNLNYVVNPIPTQIMVDMLNLTAQNVTLNVSVNDTINNKLLTASDDESGYILVYVGDTLTKTQPLTDNSSYEILVDTLNLPMVGVTITVVYSNQTINYLGSQNVTTGITITGQSANLTTNATPNPASVGDVVVISGTLKDGMGNALSSKLLTLNIGTYSDIVETKADGTYEFGYTPNANGTYEYNVMYNGGDAVYPITVESSFVVNKIPTTTTVEILNNTVGNVTLGVQVRDMYYIETIIENGTLNVTVFNDTWTKTFTADVNNVTTIIKIDDIQANSKYNVTVTYLGNNKYVNSTGVDSGGNSIIPLETVKADATLTIEAYPVEAYVGRNVTISGKLLDGMGNPITDTVYLTFNGNNLTQVSVINGNYSYTRTSQITGDVNVTVSYNGNDTINKANNSVLYHINKIPTQTYVSVLNNTLTNITLSIRFVDDLTFETISSSSKFTVTLVDDEGNLIEESMREYDLDNPDERFVITDNGVIILKTDETYLTGAYQLANVTFLGNDIYNSSSALATDEVFKKSTRIELELDEDSIYINQSATITVRLYDLDGNAIEGDVNLTIDENKTTIHVPAEGNSTVFSNTSVSKIYTILAEYFGNTSMAGSTGSINLTVNKLPTATKVTLVNSTIGNVTIKVQVNDTLNDKVIEEGTVIILVDNVESVKSLDGQESEFTLDVSTVKGVSVNVKYNGSDVYEYSIDEQFEHIDVASQLATISVNVTPNETTVGNTSVINGKLVDGMDNPIMYELVEIDVNGTSYHVYTNESGEYTVDHLILENGTFNVTVKYGGNVYVNATNNSALLTADKVKTNTVVEVLNNTLGNVTIRVTVTDEYSQKVTSGTFMVNVTGTEYEYSIEGESTTKVIDVTQSGDVDVNITFVEDYKYYSSFGKNSADGEDFNTIETQKQDVNLNVSVDRQNVDVGSIVTVSGYLTDSAGKPISNVEVNLTFAGKDSVLVPVNNGYYYYYRQTAVAGDITVNATFNGTDIYNNTSNTTEYHVTRIATNTTVEVVNNTVGNVQISVEVIDKYRNAITSGTINVTIDDDVQSYEITGRATVITLASITTIPTEPLNIRVEYLGNDTYENSTGVTKESFESGTDDIFENIDPVKQNATLTLDVTPDEVYYGENVTFTGTLVDGLENVINGTNVTITINGEFVANATVDENGVYTFNRTTEIIGQLNVTVSYEGNETVNQANITKTYKVLQIPTTTLVDVLNNTAGNVTISVKVLNALNNQTIDNGTFTVNAYGHETVEVDFTNEETDVKLDISSATEYLPVTVTYLGNYSYAPSTGIDMVKFYEEVIEDFTNITVKLQTPTITIGSEDTYLVGDLVTITGQLTDGMANNIVGQTVTVNIGDISLTNQTNSTGGYTVYFTPTVNGTFTAIASYGGNASVSSISNDTTFTVNKIDTATIVEVLNNTAGNVTISVSVTDLAHDIPIESGIFNVTVNNTNKTVSIAGETTIVNLDIQSNDTISVSVEYLGDDKYNPSTGMIDDEGNLVVFDEIQPVKQDVNLELGVLRDSIAINTPVYVRGILTNSTGGPIAGADINLTFAGKDSVIVRTNEFGIYTHERMTTVSGDVSVTAYYNGSDKYNSATESVDYNVYKLPTNTTVTVVNNTIGNVTLGVQVRDMYYIGTIIENGTFNVTVDGVSKLVDFTTGYTLIPIDITTTDEVDVKVVYLGNDTYLNSTGVSSQTYQTSDESEFDNIKADKQTATLMLNVNQSTVKVLENITFNGTLVDGLGNSITDVVDITVDNGTDSYTYTGVEVVDGYYELNRTTNMTGEVTVTVSYAGNGTVEAANATGSYVADKRPTTTTVNVINDTIGNITIGVQVNDTLNNGIITSGSGLISVTTNDGTSYHDINGETTIISVPVSDNRQYVDITVKYLGNDTYYPSAAEEFTGVEAKLHNATLTIAADPTSSYVGYTHNISGYFIDANETAISNALITITVNNQIIGEVETGTDGYYSINYTSNKEGTFTATATFNRLNAEVVNTTTNSTTFTDEKIPTGTIARIVNNTVGNVIIAVNVTANDTNLPITEGQLEITVNGVTKTKNIDDVETIIDLAGIGLNIATTQPTEITIKYLGNDTYIESIATNEDMTEFDTINADKQASTITVTVNPHTSYVNASVLISGTLKDIDNVEIKSAQVNITVTDGDGNVLISTNVTTTNTGYYELEVPEIPAGKYTVNASFYDDNYSYSSAKDSYTINKNATKVTTTVTNNTANDVTVDVTLIDQQTGQQINNQPITIIINDEEFPANILNGKTTITLPISQKGTYNITTKYDGNEYYIESNNTLRNVEVVGRTVDLDAAVDNTTLGNTTLKVNVTDNDTHEVIPDAEVIITLPNGTEITTTVGEDGTVDVPLDLPVGENEIKITYPGDETNDQTETTVKVTVQPRDSKTTAKVLDKVSGNVTIDVTVKDAETGENVPNGEVEIKVNNKVVGRGNITDGKATILTNISENGTYNITVDYKGNGNYTSSQAQIKQVKVYKLNATIPLNKINDTTIGKTVTISGKLVDQNNVSLNNTPITIKVNGVTLQKTTDKNGEYKVGYVTNVSGQNTVTVTFNGSAKYNKVSNTTTFTVAKKNTTTTFTVANDTIENTTITIKVVDASKKPVANGTVTVKDASGKTIVTATIKNGNATVKLDIPAGKQKVSVTYNENNEYYPSNATKTITVHKHEAVLIINPIQNITYTQKTNISGRLIDASGNAIKSEKIILDIDGVKVNLTTNKYGEFSKIFNTTKVGLNNVTATFAGNSLFDQAKANSTFNASKIRTFITIEDVNGTIGENITLIATVTDEFGGRITGGQFAFKVNGLTLKTNGKFEAEGSAMILSPVNGTVKITITADTYLRSAQNVTGAYGETGKYYGSRSLVPGKASLVKRDAQITVMTENTTKQDVNTTFTAIVTDVTGGKNNGPVLDYEDNFVVFKVNGITIKNEDGTAKQAKVVNGVATMDYYVPSGLAGKNTDLTDRTYSLMDVLGSGSYNPGVYNTTNLSVERSPVSFINNNVTLNAQTKEMTIKSDLVDYHNNSVKGTNTVCVKVNGLTYQINNQTVFYNVTDGKVDINLILPYNANKIRNIELVTGERVGYLGGRTTITDITRV
ncbi:MAG: Ig-like domain-containing protein [Methanosphaera sp.]|nr:Ig-like domain-containing protein [Methanosphaera sp.]